MGEKGLKRYIGKDIKFQFQRSVRGEEEREIGVGFILTF